MKHVGPALSTLLMISAGCGGWMQQAMNDAGAQAITTAPNAAFDSYKSVGLPRLSCKGDMCNEQAVDDATQLLAKSLTENCYGVVDAPGLATYAEAVAASGQKVGATIGLTLPDGNVFRLDNFATLPGEKRSPTAAELHLDAAMFGAINIGGPDSVTGFREFKLNVNMVDSRTNVSVFRGQTQGTIMDADSIGMGFQQAVTIIASGIAQKASACPAR